MINAGRNGLLRIILNISTEKKIMRFRGHDIIQKKIKILSNLSPSVYYHYLRYLRTTGVRNVRKNILKGIELKSQQKGSRKF